MKETCFSLFYYLVSARMLTGLTELTADINIIITLYSIGIVIFDNSLRYAAKTMPSFMGPR